MVSVVVSPPGSPTTVTPTADGSSTPNLIWDYATKALAQAARLPASITLLRTGGGVSAGDGGAALYARVDAEPSHSGKLRSLDRFLSDGEVDQDDGGWWEIAETQLSPEMFGAVGDGATDDASALSDALTVQRPVVGKKGATYLIASATSLTNSDFELDLNGAAIQINADVKLFSAKAAYTLARSVSSIVGSTADLSNGTVITPSDVTVLTVSTVSGYAVEDIVKVYSDDKIPGCDTADNQRLGEFGRIAAIDSAANTITLYSRLRYLDNYTTTVRVAKLNLTNRFDLRNGVIKGPVSPPASWSNPAVDVIGFFRPVIENVRFENLPDRAIRFLGCFEPTTRDVQGFNIRTNIANDAFGYLIHEQACYGGRHWAPRGENVRHVYACSAVTTSAGSAFTENYGITYATKVFGGVGFNCKDQAFDTHADGEDIEFIGCHAEATYWGEEGLQFGFALRGRRNKAIGCTNYGGSGFRAFSDFADADNSRDHEFIDCTHVYSTATSQENHAFDVLGMTGGLVSRVRIINPRVKQTTGISPHVECSFGDVTVTNGFFAAAQSGTNQGRVFECNGSAVMRIEGGVVEYTGAVGTLLRTFRLTSDSAQVHVSGLRVNCPDAGLWAYWVDCVNNNSQFYMHDVDSSRNVTTATGVTAAGASADLHINYTVNKGRTNTNAAFSTTFSTASATPTIDIGYKSSSPLFNTITCTATSVAVADVTAGKFLGQRLSLYSDTSSTQSFTVTNGGNLDLAATETVDPGATLNLRWNGTKWTKT